MWSTHLGRETRKRWQGGGHCPLSYTANPLIYALSLRYTNTNTHKNTIHAHTRNMYIHNGHCLVSQTVNQLIYTLFYNIDNTNTDIQKNTATQNTNTHAVICKIVYSIAKPVLNLTQKFREKHKNCTFPGPIHTHSVLEYYDMRNAQFSLCMTQQLKTRNDNLACWFPPPKAALSHVLPRDLCMSEISILWFNVRETVVMKVLLWLMAGSAVFFQGTLWIVFKCI